MNGNQLKPMAYALVASCVGAFAPLPVSASMTAAQAISSVAFLTGSWHCTGGGPPEDDTYTIQKNVWRDADSLGDVTTGTFDAKRQKWVIFTMNFDGDYSVNESSPSVNNSMHVTVPYPPGMSSHSFTFTKLSNTEYKLGKQTCLKK
jgi:hypothetical protein